ncbi:MAG: DUF6583 family protein [Clostridia bacterium]|nr:DUF6583 family protein [Clostridia bacterium]
MNQKKKTKVLLIIIIVLFVILLLAGGAFAYFATDIFKSDKELFFKYISQISDSEKGFLNDDLNNYLEKKETIPYNNQGNFSVNISEDENEEQYKNVNNFNIDFSGQVDTQNKKVFQNIILNYSNDVNLQLNYKQIEDKYGIQTNDVSSKFITIDINELNKLSSSSLTADDYVKTARKIQNMGKVKLEKAQLGDELNKYKDVLNEQLKPELFSKVKDENLEGYKLALEGEDLKNVIIKLLETLKEDQTVLEKINEYLKNNQNNNKITSNDIDDIIEEIKQVEELDNKKIDIIVYKEKNIISKVTLSVDDAVFSIRNYSDKNSQKIEMEVSYQNNQILKTAIIFDGLQSIQNVKENYEIELNLENYTSISRLNSSDSNRNSSYFTKYKYKLINDINFTNSSDIEEFTDNNSLILTNYNSDVTSSFLNSLFQRIQDINERDMKKLGLNPNENPIMQVIPDIGVYTTNVDYMINANNEMSELEINTFNNKFEMYQSTNLSPQTVKGLLTTISLNNENSEGYKIKEINFEGEEYEASEQNITFVKSDIDMEKNYRVEFEKDQDTGIIYRVIINAR